MVDFMRFYGSSYCENYGSVMAGPLPLRASEVSLYGTITTILDTYIQAGILTTLEVNLGVNIMCIKTLILFK